MDLRAARAAALLLLHGGAWTRGMQQRAEIQGLARLKVSPDAALASLDELARLRRNSLEKRAGRSGGGYDAGGTAPHVKARRCELGLVILPRSLSITSPINFPCLKQTMVLR